jgi:outer membrane immunogenic protein
VTNRCIKATAIFPAVCYPVLRQKNGGIIVKIQTAFIAFLLSSTAALAADLAPAPVEPAVPVDVPYSWTGFYVGALASYAWQDPSSKCANGNFLCNDADFVNLHYSLKPSGFMGGVLTGYNWEFNSGLLLGVEADISKSNVSNSVSGTDVGVFIHKVSSDYEAFGTARGRIGYAAGPALFYATAGLAWAKMNDSYTEWPNPNEFRKQSDDTSRFGWVAGVGIEYAVTRNITIKAEYIHADLGHSTMDVGYTGYSDPGDYLAKFNHSLDIVRSAVSYKF